MRKRDRAESNALQCSFCRKPSGKLFSTPGSDPLAGAYICDECIMVCATLRNDDQEYPNAAYPTEPGIADLHAEDPSTPALLHAVERWIRAEASGRDAGNELAALRDVAVQVFRVTP